MVHVDNLAESAGAHCHREHELAEEKLIPLGSRSGQNDRNFVDVAPLQFGLNSLIQEDVNSEGNQDNGHYPMSPALQRVCDGSVPVNRIPDNAPHSQKNVKNGN
jgi:hypothetical protein